jgi:ATP-dependent Clp protease, protease subunit
MCRKVRRHESNATCSDPDSYSYQSYQRQRQLTLGDLLLENRIVFLQGEIYTANANEVVMKLLYLQSENRRKDIHFYLNSPGGDVVSTLAIYDTMQILSCPVATYCVGQAASGAAVLLTGGTKGKRYALPHARVMLHQPYGGVGGQVSDIEIQAKEILRNREMLNEILACTRARTSNASRGIPIATSSSTRRRPKRTAWWTRSSRSRPPRVRTGTKRNNASTFAKRSQYQQCL